MIQVVIVKHALLADGRNTQVAYNCLQEALMSKEQRMKEAVDEKAALKSDLERILKERGALDSIRQLVVAALQPGQQLPTMMASQAHTAQPAPSRPVVFGKGR